MHNILNKINIINHLLRFLYRFRKGSTTTNFDFHLWPSIYWKWDNSVHKNCYSGYRKEELEVIETDTIHFKGKLSLVDGKPTAYWLLQQENGYYEEVDIVEFDPRLGKLYFTAYLNKKSKWQESKGTVKSQWSMKIPEGFLEEIHLFSLKWGSFYLLWKIDNIPVAFTMRAVPKTFLYPVMNNVRLEDVEYVSV